MTLAGTACLPKCVSFSSEVRLRVCLHRELVFSVAITDIIRGYNFLELSDTFGMTIEELDACQGDGSTEYMVCFVQRITIADE